MYNSIVLLPAYGRDYKSKAALLQDWEAGKDFYAVPAPVPSTPHYGMATRGAGGYTSIRDLESFKQSKVTHLHFRYNRQSQIHVVKL